MLNAEQKEIYLITGAGGHLGGVIARELIKRKKKVRALFLPEEANSLPEEAEIYRGNVCEKESLATFFSVPGMYERSRFGERVIVIHCAGIVSIKSHFDQKVMDVNVGGTRNITELCEKHRVEKLVYVSSVHALPEEAEDRVIRETDEFHSEWVKGLYSKSKAEASALVMEATKRGLNASIVMPSGIIGPYDRGNNHLTVMIQQFLRGALPAGVNGGFDFVDVRDVAAGILSCAEFGEAGRSYLMTGEYCPIPKLLSMLSDISGQKAPRLNLSISAAKLFAPAAESWARMRKQRHLYTWYSMDTLGGGTRYSYDRAHRELGYTPRPLRRTLEDTVNWLRIQELAGEPETLLKD
ncbi:MAG: NAD-dependent epimerase/dehydratase family protein [Lachnospiraceae bacterium]|nr:NAD-dependent epimerase/dehydratase family protein [Lachnospiraceae bacterium]